MKPAAKFTFDTEFRPTGDIVSEAARSRQKKTLTVEELEMLCAEARAEGARSGQVRAGEELGREVAALTIAVRAALDTSRAEIETLRAEASAIALAAARKLAPLALAALPADDVEAALRAAMREAIEEPRITLKAAPAAIAAIAPRLAAIAAEEGYEGRITAAADPSLTGADCRIEWRGGGAARDEAAILAALDTLVARHLTRSELKG